MPPHCPACEKALRAPLKEVRLPDGHYTLQCNHCDKALLSCEGCSGFYSSSVGSKDAASEHCFSFCPLCGWCNVESATLQQYLKLPSRAFLDYTQVARIQIALAGGSAYLSYKQEELDRLCSARDAARWSDVRSSQSHSSATPPPAQRSCRKRRRSRMDDSERARPWQRPRIQQQQQQEDDAFITPQPVQPVDSFEEQGEEEQPMEVEEEELAGDAAALLQLSGIGPPFSPSQASSQLSQRGQSAAGFAAPSPSQAAAAAAAACRDAVGPKPEQQRLSQHAAAGAAAGGGGESEETHGEEEGEQKAEAEEDRGLEVDPSQSSKEKESVGEVPIGAQPRDSLGFELAQHEPKQHLQQQQQQRPAHGSVKRESTEDLEAAVARCRQELQQLESLLDAFTSSCCPSGSQMPLSPSLSRAAAATASAGAATAALPFTAAHLQMLQALCQEASSLCQPLSQELIAQARAFLSQREALREASSRCELARLAAERAARMLMPNHRWQQPHDPLCVFVVRCLRERARVRSEQFQRQSWPFWKLCEEINKRLSAIYPLLESWAEKRVPSAKAPVAACRLARMAGTAVKPAAADQPGPQQQQQPQSASSLSEASVACAVEQVRLLRALHADIITSLGGAG